MPWSLPDAERGPLKHRPDFVQPYNMLLRHSLTILTVKSYDVHEELGTILSGPCKGPSQGYVQKHDHQRQSHPPCFDLNQPTTPSIDTSLIDGIPVPACLSHYTCPCSTRYVDATVYTRPPILDMNPACFDRHSISYTNAHILLHSIAMGLYHTISTPLAFSHWSHLSNHIYVSELLTCCRRLGRAKELEKMISEFLSPLDGPPVK